MMWFRRKKYLLVQMFLHHFLGFSIFKIFHTWSSYVDSKITIYNTLCWYSGKDTGLSPGRPQFKSRHHQGFLQKDLPWKFFKKWLSIRRITVWITSRSQLFPCPELQMVLSDKIYFLMNWNSVAGNMCATDSGMHRLLLILSNVAIFFKFKFIFICKN